jgi:hypothetical protein
MIWKYFRDNFRESDMKKNLLICGGIFNLFLAGFHFSFWKIFNWPESLQSLSPINLGITQVLNIHLGYVVLVFAYVSIFYHRELLTTKLGKAMVVSIIIFYILRGVNQLIFWEIIIPSSVLVSLFCVLVAIIYAIPLIFSKEISE